MSEIEGTFLVSGPAKLLEKFASTEEKTSWKIVSELMKHAGIDDADNHPIFNMRNGQDFYHNGIALTTRFMEVKVIEHGWTQVIENLVAFGNGIEIFGSVWDDYRVTQYMALNADGGRYSDSYDPEGGDESESEVFDEWLRFVPADIQEDYPELFEADFDDDDYDY